jgi:hypothetical protein
MVGLALGLGFQVPATGARFGLIDLRLDLRSP